MSYSNLEDCLIDLERNGMLVRIKDEVDPDLEMAALHLRMYEKQGPAILFENVKGTKFRAVSNLFGTLARSEFIFRNTLSSVQQIIHLKQKPLEALKRPFKYFKVGLAALNALPLKNPSNKPVLYEEVEISDLPLIKHWANDGGAFITLPQVYTEDAALGGIMNSNVGMYRIQLNGNDYVKNKEIGLHYQLHRGIGVHQTNANKLGKPLRVSIFIGGPPAHSVAAVMPLPEGMSELTFAGLLGGRRFRYCYEDGFCISTDADFVITGEVFQNQVKPEGPFGDHLGYYSLKHDFPVMNVHKVYAKKNAIWAFTVVGRPPQEDTSFGQLIHAITGKAIQQEIPGLKAVHAVDAAGVHPLLLAIGTERYTPYQAIHQPAELLTIANHILGTGQLSLAKYLFITAEQNDTLDVHNIEQYMQSFLERFVLQRDVHFYTNTSIDTLDYSGTNLNMGSKVVFASYGKKVRELCKQVKSFWETISIIKQAKVCMPGVIAIEMIVFTTYENAKVEMQNLSDALLPYVAQLNSCPILVVCDNAIFTAETLSNYLWVTYTRSNPAMDIYGVDSFIENKHWGCNGALIIDARMKPHHAPALVKDKTTEERINRFFEKGAALEKWK
jgi:4-hydroxy-3-polyprenylbenzoate decarboxylase